MTAPPLQVGLGEYDIGWHDPQRSLAGAAEIVSRQVTAGARMVVLPEMAPTGFTMDAAQAVPQDDPIVGELAAIAARNECWLLAGIALRERSSAGVESHATNAAILFDPSGRIATVHRKRKLFAYAGEHERYAAGTGSTLATVDGVRVAILICYELRFAALFAAQSQDAELMVVIANWPAARRAHWDALLPARAIENQCYVAGVNRTGCGDGVNYDGGSVVYDPWGERLPADDGVVTVDPARVREIRERYPFLRDA